MLKKSLWGTTVAVLVGAGLLLAPGISEAQRRGASSGGRSGGGSWSRGGAGYGNQGRGGWNRGYGYGGYPGFGVGIYPGFYGWGANGYYGADGYAPESYGVAQPGYQAFYPPNAGNNQAYAEPPQAPVTDPRTAGFMVRVPDPNAVIWFQDYQTQQRGTVREYESPALKPNQSYTFHLRAQWTQNGSTVNQSRDVQVRAGQRVNVNFSTPANENVPARPAAQLPRDIEISP